MSEVHELLERIAKLESARAKIDDRLYNLEQSVSIAQRELHDAAERITLLSEAELGLIKLKSRL